MKAEEYQQKKKELLSKFVGGKFTREQFEMIAYKNAFFHSLIELMIRGYTNPYDCMTMLAQELTAETNRHMETVMKYPQPLIHDVNSSGEEEVK